jgi:hypothetical protein
MIGDLNGRRRRLFSLDLVSDSDDEDEIYD